MVTVGVTSLKASTITSAQNFITASGHKHDFAFDHVHEFFRQRVPVTLTRPRACLKLKKVYTNRFQASDYAKATAQLVLARCIKRFWIP